MNNKDLDDLIKLNPFTKTEYYPIKNKVLNGLLGGKGLPKGSIVHIAAGSGTGKSTVCLKDICLDLLKQGLDIAYIDADRGINENILKSTGVYPFLNNTDKKLGGTFVVFQKSSFKEVNELVQDLVEKGVQVIVIDTISIMDSGMYIGKNSYDIENRKVGGEAGTLRQFIKNLNFLATEDTRQLNFILLNHTAKEIGGSPFGPPKETPKGGDAPIQYSDIVLQLYKYGSKSEMLNDKPIGQKVYAEIIKSRHAMGKVKVPFFIRYGKGISNILTYKEVFESGKAVPGCYIETKGRTYYLKHPKLTEEIKYVGKDNLLKCIIENYTTIDRLFTAKDWTIDTSAENAILDVEYSLEDISLLPKALQDKKIVTSMNDNVYFLRGIDILGQPYGVYYNLTTKKLIKEYNSTISNITTREFDNAIKSVENYVENLKNEQENKSVDELLDEVEINE
mgnify:CR=1 FL=1